MLTKNLIKEFIDNFQGRFRGCEAEFTNALMGILIGDELNVAIQERMGVMHLQAFCSLPVKKMHMVNFSATHRHDRLYVECDVHDPDDNWKVARYEFNRVDMIVVNNTAYVEPMPPTDAEPTTPIQQAMSRTRARPTDEWRLNKDNFVAEELDMFTKLRHDVSVGILKLMVSTSNNPRQQKLHKVDSIVYRLGWPEVISAAAVVRQTYLSERENGVIKDMAVQGIVDPTVRVTHSSEWGNEMEWLASIKPPQMGRRQELFDDATEAEKDYLEKLLVRIEGILK